MVPFVASCVQLWEVYVWTSLTRKDVIRTIGDVDDVTVADITATGATAQEL
jgi:hypothetical protein